MLKTDAKTKRILLWISLGFLVLMVVMIIVGLVRKKKATPKITTGTQIIPGNTGTTVPTTIPSTSTPPIVPPASENNSSLPSQVFEINWTYINDLAWKMDEVQRATGAINPGIAAYKCEITNGIMEMGSRDLGALVQVYRQWYGRSFRDNYCQKVTSSGCWTTLWDSKPQEACKKLKSYA